ncbi:MAG: hypothetical protein KDB10_06445 [Acidimicrobiales bacterium]|nr:hypothetical protein [Acidimicrobiales bacterium]
MGGAEPDGRARGSHAILAVVTVLVLLGAACDRDPAVPTTTAPGSVPASGVTIPAPPAAAPPAPTSVRGPTVDAGSWARLRVTQDLTSCCYPTGHLSWLVIRDASGAEAAVRRVRPLADPVPLVDLALASGRYHVVAAQQPCADAACTVALDVVDRCDADVDLGPGSTTFLSVGVAPGAGCAIVLAPGPLAAPVADEVALVPAGARDCGSDGSLAAAARSGAAVRPSAGRTCLVAAAAAGEAAWLLAEEPEDASATSSVLVYRLGAGGTGITVYRPVDPTAPTWAWVRSECTAVTPDAVRAFLVRGCRPPEPVPWRSAP